MTNDHEPSFYEVKSAAIQFMKSLSDHYGPEKGIEAWDNIAQHIPSDLRNEIFMTLLSNTTYSTVYVVRDRDSAAETVQKVNAIKLIRYRTGLGLKEAKDIVDQAEYSQAKMQIHGMLEFPFLHELKQYGYKIIRY